MSLCYSVRALGKVDLPGNSHRQTDRPVFGGVEKIHCEEERSRLPSPSCWGCSRVGAPFSLSPGTRHVSAAVHRGFCVSETVRSAGSRDTAGDSSLFAVRVVVQQWAGRRP